ncbi:MAG: ComF family protein [Lachnospiraceae bacterium]|nr:ComF family protein [Lachnospiraceae bacterium]
MIRPERLIFPRRCPICDDIITDDSLICSECITIPRRVPYPRCMKCSKHIDSQNEEYCRDCQKNDKSFLRGVALYEYDSVKDSINSFKNNSRPEYGEFYGAQIARYLGDEIRNFEADALIPVPLHRSKMLKRGYNQSEVLAKHLSNRLGIPLINDVLIRCKKTKEQKKLTNLQREKNLRGAFHIAQKGVKLYTVILVDDVYTTGSTLDEASKVLLEAGVGRVYFVTIAVGIDR